MQTMIIVKPIPPVAVVSQSLPTMSRALTPDPKEAFAVAPNTGVSIVLDFGAAITVDTGFVGYHTALLTQDWSLIACDASGAPTGVVVPGGLLKPLGYGPPFHAFRRGSPQTSRYFKFTLSAAGVGFSVGVLAIGLAWQSTWGQEMGGGKQVIDTGSVERLFGGGFGIDDGTAADAFQWTLGDLQADEIRTLYQIVKDRRTTRTVLVVEDPEQTDGLNERIHWGLFQKLDFFERADPANWKWSLEIADWA